MQALRTSFSTLLLLLLSAGLAAAAPFEVLFVSIGQGDSLLVKAPSGQVWLVDGGPKRKEATVSIREGLCRLGAHRLDGILISHPHLDHFGGMIRLLDHVEVGKILYGLDIDATTYTRFKTKAEGKGIPLFPVEKGPLDWGAGLEVEVLHKKEQHQFDLAFESHRALYEADRAAMGEMLIRGCSLGELFGIDLNSYSLVLKLRYRGFELLLTGDATHEVEEQLLAEGADLDADVLKVAHHGSKYSSTLEFLDAVSPQDSVIQSGAGNSHGHPHGGALRRLLDQGIQIRRNDLHGDILLEVEADGSFQLSDDRRVGYRRPQPECIQAAQDLERPLATLP